MNDTLHEIYSAQAERQGVLHKYLEYIARGDAPGTAIMYASKRPPGTKNTDQAFCQGARHRMESMSPRVRKALLFKAKQAGISTDGKFYVSGLGGHTNPAAWVSSAEDVITSCKVQNKTAEGVVNYKGTVKEVAPPNIPLADDLVAEMAHKICKAEPGTAEKVRKSKKARGELRERVIATYGKRR
jgi:hypothetical protein